jgi:hypothetical protein
MAAESKVTLPYQVGQWLSFAHTMYSQAEEPTSTSPFVACAMLPAWLPDVLPLFAPPALPRPSATEEKVII